MQRRLLFSTVVVANDVHVEMSFAMGKVINRGVSTEVLSPTNTLTKPHVMTEQVRGVKPSCQI